MCHMNADPNRTWQELTEHVMSLVGVERIDFPLCPASVLHTVAEKLTSIKHLVAESVVENVQEPWSVVHEHFVKTLLFNVSTPCICIRQCIIDYEWLS